MDDDSLQEEGIVEEAKRLFQLAVEFESKARKLFLEDIKFDAADADNGWQWPDEIKDSRQRSSRPCLTMNVVHQHNLQIVNDAKQSPSSIEIKPVGNGATKEAAEVFQALVRRIENESRAQNSVYSLGRKYQVTGGIGYWRVVTEYSDDNSFDQEIFLRPVIDPLAVFLDPAMQLADGSDARWGIIFDDVPRKEFFEAYPKLKGKVNFGSLGMDAGGNNWINKENVRICEFFKKVAKADKLVSFIDPESEQRQQIKMSLLPENIKKDLLDDPLTLVRDIAVEEIEWYLIVGQEIVEQTIWPGKYIPIVRVVGEESLIDGLMDRKGHTRAMKDAQRMFNYNASAQVEFVALQSKTPWVSPAAAIESHEEYWDTANTENHSILPYNHVDENGQTIPPPSRQNPPVGSPAFEAGMTTAFNQMMMVSGQWQNQMGMMGNERTGEAISQRQEQGDTATFHYRDNFEAALVHTGAILLDLIPKIYDTKRVFMIQADDGVDYELEINPQAQQAFMQQLVHELGTVRSIFNPKIGKYAVSPSAGMSYGTKREKTVRAMTMLLTQAPALTGLIGDLLLSSMDFKEAQEAAQRLKRMIPPQAMGQGPTENEQMLQAQVQKLTAVLEKSLQKSAVDHVKLIGKAELRNISAYQAETDRMKALKDFLATDPDGVDKLVRQLVDESLQNVLGGVIGANADDLQNETEIDSGERAVPPVAGAQKAPDGQWYLKDPTRVGKYLRLEPLAGQGAGNG